MRRLLRILFNALTVLSLVLAVLVAGMWVRSYRWREAFGASGSSGAVFLHSELGQLQLFAHRTGGPHAFTYDSDRQPRRATGLEAGVRTRWGFGFSAGQWFRYKPLYIVAVPHWFLFTCAGASPAVTLVSYIRRPNRGLCTSCGYDLRATPERCPECGAVPGTIA